MEENITKPVVKPTNKSINQMTQPKVSQSKKNISDKTTKEVKTIQEEKIPSSKKNKVIKTDMKTASSIKIKVNKQLDRSTSSKKVKLVAKEINNTIEEKHINHRIPHINDEKHINEPKTSLRVNNNKKPSLKVLQRIKVNKQNSNVSKKKNDYDQKTVNFLLKEMNTNNTNRNSANNSEPKTKKSNKFKIKSKYLNTESQEKNFNETLKSLEAKLHEQINEDEIVVEGVKSKLKKPIPIRFSKVSLNTFSKKENKSVGTRNMLPKPTIVSKNSKFSKFNQNTNKNPNKNKNKLGSVSKSKSQSKFDVEFFFKRDNSNNNQMKIGDIEKQDNNKVGIAPLSPINPISKHKDPILPKFKVNYLTLI